MFTGLIEEIGTINKSVKIRDGRIITIGCSKILSDLKPDNSVSVNGVCLTATKIHGSSFEATAVKETLERSNLNHTRAGNRVNIERALCLNDRLGGHMIQGHVDGIGFVRKISLLGSSHTLEKMVN